MKTLEQIEREFRERRASLEEVYDAVRRRGRNVPVTPEQLAHFVELCSQTPTISSAPGSSSSLLTLTQYIHG